MPGAIGSAIGTVAGNAIAPGIGGAIGGSLGGAIGGSIGGGGARSGASAPLFFNAGGMTSGTKNGKLFVNETGDRTALIKAISQNYLDNANSISGTYMPQFQNILNSGVSALDSQIGLVKPGYGGITDALVNSVQNAGQSSASDLRSSLAKRRVLGSSFADAAQSQQNLEVGQQVAAAKAQGFLSELQATNALVSQKYQMQTQGTQALMDLSNSVFNLKNAANQTKLDEMNDLKNTAVSLLSGVQAQQSANAQAEAKFAQENITNSATLGTSLTNQISGLFGGGGGSTAINWNVGQQGLFAGQPAGSYGPGF